MATREGKTHTTKHEAMGRRRRGNVLAHKRAVPSDNAPLPIVKGQNSPSSKPLTERERKLFDAILDLREERAAEARKPRRPQRISVEITRRHLAMAVVLLVSITTISAIVLPSGLEVLDKLLPSFAFVLGYFYQPRHDRDDGRSGG